MFWVLPGAGESGCLLLLLLFFYFSDFWQMKWMEPFLEKGAVGGKIICPNKKCGGKAWEFRLGGRAM